MAQRLAEAVEYCLDFSRIVNVSITASWLILAILLLRPLLKKSPRWLHVALWGLVAVRLLLPVSLESAFSLIPSTETIPQTLLQSEGVALQDLAHLLPVSNPVYVHGAPLELHHTVDRVQISFVFLTLIWIGGMTAILVYTALSYWQLRRNVRTAVHLRYNIFQSEYVTTPFVLGLIRPRIYLPYDSAISAKKCEDSPLFMVVKHEQAHLLQWDHWWKALGFLLLTIHWFNPLMWLAYHLLCRDMELAADEAVLKELTHDQRADYSQTLLTFSVKRRPLFTCPLAFGEIGVSQRIRAALGYQTPSLWAMGAAIVSCVIIAMCFLTDPMTGDSYRLIQSGNTMDRFLATYDFSLGRKADQGTLYVEDWVDGVCVNSCELAYLDPDIRDLTIQLAYRWEGNQTIGIDMEVDSKEQTGQTTTTYFFPFPEPKDGVGSHAFTTHEKYQLRPIQPDDELVLTALFLGTDGITVAGCALLEQKPYYQEPGQHYIIVRAVFGDGLKKPQLAPPLDSAITAAIQADTIDELDGNQVHLASYVLLDAEANRDDLLVELTNPETFTAYLLVRHEIHTLENGRSIHSSHRVVPTVITLQRTEAMTYTVTDYWSAPRGSGGEHAVRDRFPRGIVKEALNPENYEKTLGQQCYYQLQEILQKS